MVWRACIADYLRVMEMKIRLEVERDVRLAYIDVKIIILTLEPSPTSTLTSTLCSQKICHRKRGNATTTEP